MACPSAMPIHYVTDEPPPADRPLLRALWTGFRRRCPACGEGRLFRAYLKVADRCPHCGADLYHQRADDAPPYFVMMIVGHLIVPLVLSVEIAFRPPLWLHAVVWVPAAFLLAMLLLPRVKGAIVGLQWALRMHGFGSKVEAERLAAYGEPATTSSGRP